MPNLPEEIKNQKQNSRYIPLAEAGEILGTSRDYLNVLVRRGKLRAVKLGRNWFTTSEWISEYKTPAGKLEWEEKAELASLRDASLAERLERVESEFVSLRDISRREKNIQTFKDREISKQISTVIASQEIKLPSRTLEPEEKIKILEAAGQRSRTFDSNQFHDVSKKLGVSGSLKSWSAKKLAIASGLAGILLLASLGMAAGIINFQFSIFNFQNKYQANIFSNALKNFPDDIPQFSNWLAGGIKKSISFFNPSQTDLTIKELESGEPKIAIEKEFPNSIDSLAQAEALDAQAMEESPFFAGTPEGQQTGGAISISGSNFSLFENRLSLVESNLEDQAALINSELSIQKKTILGVIETIFGIAELVPRHPGSTIVVQGQPATLTTYSVSPQVHSGFDRLSATYLTLASDATINGSLTVESGGNFNSLSVSGSTSLSTLTLTSLTSTGDIVIGGTLAVTGTTTVDDITVNGTINIPGNSVFGNSSTTNATLTNFWSTNGTITNGIITNGTITNASTTYATIPTFWGTNGTIANLTNTNASSTNLTATNFWSTNGTITNASTTYLTVGNNFWGAEGLFSGAVQTPLVWNNGTLTASTTGANPIIFATNSSERMRIDANGYVAIGTTTVPSGFGFNVATSTFTYGNQFISGGLGVGVATTTSGALQTSGSAFIGGDLYVSGDSTVLGDSTVIGGSFTDTLTVNSAISSDLIPSVNNTYDLGSTSYYWDKAYVNTLTVNSISAASTTIGGTQSETFTINSDNTTADTETETIIFFRGTIVPNALLTWNAATSSKRFEFNQTLYINNGSASTTNPIFTIQSIANQTANALQILDNNSSAYFTVNPVGNNTTMINASTTNLTVTGNLWSASNSTSTFNGAILLSNGSATAPSLAFINDTQTGLYKLATSKMGFVTAGLDRLMIDSDGNVGVGTTTPNNLLTLYKSQASGTNLAVYNPAATGYTSLILGSDSTSASSSISFYNASYPTSGLAGSLELRTGSSNDILIRSGRYTGVGTAITSPQATIDIGTSDAYNNTIVDEAIIRHNTTGTAGNGLGAALSFWGQAAEGTNQQLARIAGVVEQASTTNGFASYLSFWTVGSAGIQEKMRLTSVGGLELATTTMPSGYGANIATSTYVYGNLTVSGNSIFNNSSTTNSTLTNFWSTNGTITNASTTYATIPTFWSSGANITGGTITGITDLTVADGGTGASTLAGLLQGNGASAITGITGTAGQIPYYNGTDTLLATSTIFLATSGNVGIGTTTPIDKLEVVSPTYQIRAAGSDWGGITLSDTGATSGQQSFNLRSENGIFGIHSINDDQTQYVTTSILTALYSGNVGIGTSTPGSLFSVHSSGNTYLGGNLTVSGNSIFNNSSTTNSTLTNFWSTNGTIANASSTYGTITDFWTTNATTTTFRAGGLATFGGNVGIGTTNPAYALDLYSENAATSTILALRSRDTAVGSPPFSVIEFRTSSTGNVSNVFPTARIVAGFDGENYADARLTFQYPDVIGTYTDAMSIKNSFVGIGTTTPGNFLSVHSTGNVYFGGNLTVSGNSIFNNSSTTNATLTNFWGTNGTITNASTTYATIPTFWSSSANITGGTITGITDLTVADGGTGASTFTDHGVLIGSGTDPITALTVGTNGQLLVGSTGADPVFATLNCANGLTCTTGAGTLQVDFDGGDSPAGELGNTWASPTIDDSLAVTSWTLTTPIFSGIVNTDNNWLSGDGGAEGISIDDSGNVGIGTSSPAYKLDVWRAGNPPALALLNDATGGSIANNEPLGNIFIGGKEDEGGTDSDAIQIKGFSNEAWTSTAHGTYLTFSITPNATTAVAEAMRILNNGNVGIGETVPGAKLSVSGGLAVGSSYDTTTVADGNVIISGSVGIGTTDPGATKFKVTSDPAEGNTQIGAVSNSATNANYGGYFAGNSAGNVMYMTVGDASFTPAQYWAKAVWGTIAGSGGVGLRFNADGGTDDLVISTDNNVGIGTSTPGTYKLNVAGTGYLNTSAWVYASDIRLKENISYLGGGLAQILQLKPARFDYITGEKNQLGFIAQDVQGVIPEAVIFNENSGMYGLKSDFIIPYLVTAIQELNAKMASSTIATSTLQAGNGTIDLTTLNADLNLNGFSILNVKSIVGINNLWSIDSEGNIIAKSVQTQALTVGGGAASGITVYDRQTSAPKCIYIEGGAIMSSDGACGTTQNAGVVAPISETIPVATSSVSDIIPDAATSTEPILTEPVATTTPEIITATTTPETATTTP